MRKLFAITLTLLLAGAVARAQDEGSDNDELNIIEVELEKSKPSSAPAPADKAENAPAAAQEQKPIDFQGLGGLAPFTEVSVIQRRFLPKTGRFQLFGGPTLITNDPFFNTVGLAVKAGYFFTESFGVELNHFLLSTSEAKATKELKDIQNLGTESLVLTKGFTALDLTFVPIYGKMTWFNERIVPFDTYFSLGGGSTKTETENAGTLHLGAGQIFAISKATAFRWDFSWNFFNATGVDGKKAAYNNLFMTVGFGWFFPEAKYR